MANNKPSSIAMVKSKITVKMKVVSNTQTSALEFFNKERKVRHSLMLYDTITNTPARQAIGICLVKGPRNKRISNKTTA